VAVFCREAGRICQTDRDEPKQLNCSLTLYEGCFDAFDPDSKKTAATPMEEEAKLVESDKPIDPELKEKFGAGVGSVMFPMRKNTGILQYCYP
jgi:hypothetical protein